MSPKAGKEEGKGEEERIRKEKLKKKRELVRRN